MKDFNHNLIHVLSEKLDNVWKRYDKYIEDSEDDSCRELWKKIKEDEEKHIEMLKNEIIKHVQSGNFE